MYWSTLIQMNVSGPDVKAIDSLNIYASTELERLERHFDRITNTKVIPSLEKTL